MACRSTQKCGKGQCQPYKCAMASMLTEREHCDMSVPLSYHCPRQVSIQELHARSMLRTSYVRGDIEWQLYATRILTMTIIGGVIVQ